MLRHQTTTQGGVHVPAVPVVPSIAAFGADLTTATANAAAVPVPAGVVANNVIIVQIGISDSTTIVVNSLPNGFTEVPHSPIYTSSMVQHRSHIFWKRAAGSDTGTYNFGLSGSAPRRGKAFRIENCATTGDPIQTDNSWAASGYGGSLGPVSAVTTQDKELLLFIASLYDTNRTALNAPSGFIENLEQDTEGRLIATMAAASIGATGNLSGTSAPSSYGQTVWLGALLPGVSSPSAPDTEPPSTPTGLVATPASTSVALTWTASTDNVGVASYLVSRGGVHVGTVSTLSFTDIGLNSLTTYTYQVSAVDAAGNQSTAATVTTTTTASGLPPLWNASPPAGVSPAPSGPWVDATAWDAATLATNEIWDNFDGPVGSDPDSRLWLEDTVNQGGTQIYDPANSFLDGASHAVFEATGVPGNVRSGRFTSRTKFNMQYGWCAARIKMPKTSGSTGLAWFPAFWMFSVPGDSAHWSEYDIIEMFGNSSQYSTTIWFPGGVPVDSGHIPCPGGINAGDDFHTYWLLWEPNRIQVGVDDFIMGTWTPASVSSDWDKTQQPHYYIANFAVAPSWLPAPVPSDFPARMLIDWIWYKPLSTGSTSVSAHLAGSGHLSATASVVAGTTGHPFYILQEYFHDGGALATNQTADLGIIGASFKAVLTSGETSYLAAHHPAFVYFCLPQNLIRSSVSINYPQTLDDNYLTTMANMVSAYGNNRMYLFAMPEWDNDPANAGWAQNRFSEAGVGGLRPDIPTGLTNQQAYDQFFHFYTANNHGGNTDHHQLGQLLSAQRSYKIQANCVNAGSCHYAYEMGVDQVTLQRNNDGISGIIGSMGFIRGAGTQYGKEWGWDISGSRANWAPGGETAYDGSHNLISGWTPAMYRRLFYLMYGSGADMIMMEALYYTTNGWFNINGTNYTPTAIEIRNFCDFALTRHSHRGVPHVPIAIMKDHISFLEPRFGLWNQGRAVWYQQIGPNGGENMMHNLFDTLYPGYNNWGTSTTTAEPMGSARWGEQFDIVTERITGNVLSGNYQVAIVAMNTVMDSTLQTKLNDFATAGGIVVLNAKQLSGTNHETMTGVHITGTASTSGVITWNSDSSTTNEGPYNYSTCTLSTATTLAHSGASTPQVTRNVVGSGEVWVTMPDYMSNASNNALLGLGEKVIQVLVDRFAKGWLLDVNHFNYDYLVNKNAGVSGTATTVTLINTDVSGTTFTGTLVIPATVTSVQEWVTDTVPSSTQSDGNTHISVSVPAGDVRVYAVDGLGSGTGYWSAWSNGPSDSVFPIGAWLAYPLNTNVWAPFTDQGAAMADAGINLIIGDWSWLSAGPAYLNRVAALGMKAIPNGPNMSYLAAHPEHASVIIGWQGGDEYDMQRPPRPSTTNFPYWVRDNIYTPARAADPTRPLHINYGKTLAAIGTSETWWRNSYMFGGNDTGTFDGDMKVYVDSCDAVSFDYYWWSDVYETWNGAAGYGQSLDSVRRYVTNKARPMWGFVENSRTQGGSGITPDHMESAIWSMIVHGAKGFCYFIHDFPASGTGTGGTGIWANTYYDLTMAHNIHNRMKTVNSRIQGYAPVLLSPQTGTVNSVGREVPPITINSTNGVPIDAMVRHYSGQTFVFAQASGGESLPASGSTTGTFTLSGVGTKSVTVDAESRTVQATNDVWQDTFTAYQMHVYVI